MCIKRDDTLPIGYLKDKDATKHFPAEGEGTLSGVIVETDTKTGLAKNVIRVIDGGSLTK